MSEAQDGVRQRVLAVLATVAPEMEPAELDPRQNFRDQMDFDSMDFLNFVIGLHKAFGVDVPEADYPKLFSLAGCVEYLSRPAQPAN